MQPIGQNWSHDPSAITKDAGRCRRTHGVFVECCYLCHRALAAPHTGTGAFELSTKECKAGPLPRGRPTATLLSYQPQLISTIGEVETKLMRVGGRDELSLSWEEGGTKGIFPGRCDSCA